MADLIVCAGETANILTTAKAVTMTNEHAVHEKGFLHDGRTSKKAQFLTNAADLTITVDGDMLHRGDFEVSTLSGWTDASTGAGSSAETVVGAEVHSGTKALKCTGAVGATGGRTREITVRTGQRVTVHGWQRSDGTATGRVEVYCPETGHYLTSGGAWQAGQTDVFTHGTTTYTEKTLAFQMETIAICQGRVEVTLRTKLYVFNQAAAATFDDFDVFPTVNLVGVFGHNVCPVVVPRFQSSPDNSAWTTEATLTPLLPTFYGYLTVPVAKRYWRLKLEGTNVTTPWLGELVIGYGESMTRRPNLGSSFEQSYEQQLEESVAGGGDVWVLTKAQELRRTFAMRFDFQNQTVMDEARREIFQRSQGPRWPIVVIPDSTKADVIHGRIDRSWRVARTFVTYYTDNDLMLLEDPFPVEVS